jgi:hypothetical protein
MIAQRAGRLRPIAKTAKGRDVKMKPHNGRLARWFGPSRRAVCNGLPAVVAALLLGAGAWAAQPQPGGGAPARRPPLAPAWWDLVRPRNAKERQAVAAIKATGALPTAGKDGELLQLAVTGQPGLGDTFGDEHMAMLPDLPSLEWVGVESQRVSNAGLAYLARLPRLRSVSLKGAQFDARGLAQLRALPRLTQLFLIGTGADDSTMRIIGEMRGLQLLTIGGSPITDDGLAPLEGLKCLESLALRDTRVDDAGLAHLAGLVQLRWLAVEGERKKGLTLAYPPFGIGDTGLRHLQRLAKLGYLSTLVGVTDEGTRYLADKTELAQLNLRWASITDAGLVHLSRLNKLKELCLPGAVPPGPAYGPRITDAGLPRLAGLAGLGILDLSGQPITDAGVRRLVPLRSLKSLYLAGTKVTDAATPALSQMPGLEEIALDETQITDAGLARLKPLAKLRGLGLARTRVTDRGLDYLLELPNLDNRGLSELNLHGTAVTEEGIQEYRKKRESLKSIP